MTLNIIALSITSLSIMTLSIMKLSIMTLSIMKLRIMTLSIMKLIIMTLRFFSDVNLSLLPREPTWCQHYKTFYVCNLRKFLIS